VNQQSGTTILQFSSSAPPRILSICEGPPSPAALAASPDPVSMFPLDRMEVLYSQLFHSLLTGIMVWTGIMRRQGGRSNLHHL